MNRISMNEDNLLRYGIDSDLAHRAAENSLTLTKIRSLSISDIAGKFSMSEDEAKELKKCVIRNPIDVQIVGQLLNASNFVCTICKGTKSHAYIIHHIEPYEQTQDNSYDNLIVLCPSDHDLAHNSGGLTLRISKTQLIDEKLEWEMQVKNNNLHIASRSINLNMKVKEVGDSEDERTLHYLMYFANFTQLALTINNLPRSFDLDLLDVAEVMNSLMIDRPHAYPFSDKALQETYGEYLDKYKILYRLIVGKTNGVPHFMSANQVGTRFMASRNKAGFKFHENVAIDEALSKARDEFDFSYRKLISFLRQNYPKVKLDAYEKY